MSGVLAIIPARGGSKGIPGKNLLPVGGVPIVGRAVLAGVGADAVDRVVVSTDDDRIAAAAEAYGAEVVRRPGEISGDLASSEAALLHAMDAAGGEPELVVFLQCTNPLTAAADVDGCVRIHREADADSTFAAVASHRFLWRRGEGGAAEGVNHDPTRRLMRQEREPEYAEAGSVYVMDAAGFRRDKHRFFGKIAVYEMPAERWWEVDEPADLDVVASKLRRAEQLAAIDRLPAVPAGLALDFDGVLTDNRVHVREDGTEGVACDRSDGWGIAALRRQGLPITVVSTEVNPVVAARCRKLSIPATHGVEDKVAALAKWVGENDLMWRDVIFCGNDVNDLPAIAHLAERGGCTACPADAHADVQRACGVVLSRDGGRGAVRELCELVAARRGWSVAPQHPRSEGR